MLPFDRASIPRPSATWAGLFISTIATAARHTVSRNIGGSPMGDAAVRGARGQKTPHPARGKSSGPSGFDLFPFFLFQERQLTFEASRAAPIFSSGGGFLVFALSCPFIALACLERLKCENTSCVPVAVCENWV